MNHCWLGRLNNVNLLDLYCGVLCLIVDFLDKTQVYIPYLICFYRYMRPNAKDEPLGVCIYVKNSHCLGKILVKHNNLAIKITRECIYSDFV